MVIFLSRYFLQAVRGRTRILTDSARKINKKEVLANYYKTRINKGHQHDRWMELKEALRVQTHAKCKRHCHYACIVVRKLRHA